MIPVISVPNVQPPPIQASVVTAATSNITVGSLPMTFVAPAVSMTEMGNYAKGGNAVRPDGSASVNVALTYSPAPSTPAPQTMTSQLGFTSQFMAQAFAQGSEEENASLSALFDDAVPDVVDTGTYLTYNMVKYLPSNAAIPKMVSPNMELVSGKDMPPAPKPDAVSANVAQVQSDHMQQAQRAVSSNVQSADMATNVIKTAPNAAVVPSQQAGMFAPVKQGTRSEGRRGETTSLVKPTGFNAYVASMARNAANISGVGKPQFSATL